jgi:hypothetical protein
MADGEAKAAEVAAKHLVKQLADQQKTLAAKQSDAGRLQQARLRLQHCDRLTGVVPSVCCHHGPGCVPATRQQCIHS